MNKKSIVKHLKIGQIMPEVSIIMPVYNAEAFIKETIDSILSQTFTNFELLALNDGSTDRSAEIIQAYNDPRVKYIRCSHDFISTLNHGIEIALGKYIARMDHDDLMMPERLQKQYEFMEKHPEISACGGCMQTFGNYSKTVNVLTDHNDIILRMLLCNPMANPTGFIRKSILIDHNIRHESGYSFADDYKLWTEIAKVGRLANIPEVLTKYRVSSEQATAKNYESMMKASNRIQYEMLYFFLENFIPVEEFGKMVSKKLLPCIGKLKINNFFSKDVYFNFMYELIFNLRLRGNFSI
jgi:glycosyltransferase involved in cell wall biosynthesis